MQICYSKVRQPPRAAARRTFDVEAAFSQRSRRVFASEAVVTTATEAGPSLLYVQMEMEMETQRFVHSFEK
jgi:hypothetical protein